MLKLLPDKAVMPYTEFYSAHYSRVLNYVRKKINSAEDAEDLTADVFLYCYSHYDDYDPEKSSMTTWLYLIVNSRIKNYYRDHVSHVDLEQVSAVLPDDSIDLDYGVYLEQLHDSLMKAIATLPERQQKIVYMKYFQNMTSEEIATSMLITPGNVRVLLNRALNKLKSSCTELSEGVK